MDSAEREILSLLGSVNTGFAFLVALAVLVLGIVVVRPLNKVAGLAFAGAGGGRILGLGLDTLVKSLQPQGAGVDAAMVFHSIGTLIWIVTALAFYGGIMFGAVKLSETPTQRGAW